MRDTTYDVRGCAMQHVLRRLSICCQCRGNVTCPASLAGPSGLAEQEGLSSRIAQEGQEGGGMAKKSEKLTNEIKTNRRRSINENTSAHRLAADDKERIGKTEDGKRGRRRSGLVLFSS